MRRLALLTLFSTTLSPACGPGKDPSDTEGTGDATATTATGETPGSPTAATDEPTDGAVTAATEGPGTATATSGETEGGPNPATSDTDGPGLPSLEESCMAACVNFDMCLPGEFGPVGECTAFCVEESQPGGELPPGCTDAFITYNQCVAAATCRELTGEEGVCFAEEEAIDTACLGDDAGCSVGIGPPSGDSCGRSLSCPDKDQSFLCEGDTCACIEDGVETKSCPAMMVCQAEDWSDALRAAAAACCGFEL